MKTMQIIENQTFDQERAFYGSSKLLLRNCAIDGAADGESAFKECGMISVERCYFNLRYPFWHVDGLMISDSEMTELCRAALWYSQNIYIEGTKLHGIKALRQCAVASISGCDVLSPEFGWSSRRIEMNDCDAAGEYFFLRGENLNFRDVRLTGKYSFQYVKDSLFENCRFDTKDAFWHSENVTVKNSVIKGEYLAWYASNLTLERCKIIGTQPLCYCEGLRLIDCEMYDADLCFEKSDVSATVTTRVESIKNPRSGAIALPELGELIRDDPESKALVEIGGR